MAYNVWVGRSWAASNFFASFAERSACERVGPRVVRPRSCSSAASPTIKPSACSCSLSPTHFGEGMKREHEIVPESRKQRTTLKEDDLNASIQPIMCPVAPASQGVFWKVTRSSKQRIGLVCVGSDQSRKY